jgi:hypothetical protein
MGAHHSLELSISSTYATVEYAIFGPGGLV